MKVTHYAVVYKDEIEAGRAPIFFHLKKLNANFPSFAVVHRKTHEATIKALEAEVQKEYPGLKAEYDNNQYVFIKK